MRERETDRERERERETERDRERERERVRESLKSKAPPQPFGSLTDKVLRVEGAEGKGLNSLGESDASDFAATAGVPESEGAGTQHHSQQLLTCVLN